MNLASVKENIIKDVARVFFAVISLILVSLLTTNPDRNSMGKMQTALVSQNSNSFLNENTPTRKQELKKKKLRRPSSI